MNKLMSALDSVDVTLSGYSGFARASRLDKRQRSRFFYALRFCIANPNLPKTSQSEPVNAIKYGKQEP